MCNWPQTEDLRHTHPGAGHNNDGHRLPDPDMEDGGRAALRYSLATDRTTNHHLHNPNPVQYWQAGLGSGPAGYYRPAILHRPALAAAALQLTNRCNLKRKLSETTRLETSNVPPIKRVFFKKAKITKDLRN